MDQQTSQEPLENRETPVSRPEEEKVNLNQLEQIAAQQREEALEQEDEKALEEAHSDAEPRAERATAQELSEAEIQELSALDRLAIVERLEQLYGQKQLEEAKNVVALLRLKYKEKTGLVKKEALDRFLEEGGNKIDFRFSDKEEERFVSISQKIREYHQKKREEQEKQWCLRSFRLAPGLRWPTYFPPSHPLEWLGFGGRYRLAGFLQMRLVWRVTYLEKRNLLGKPFFNLSENVLTRRIKWAENQKNTGFRLVKLGNM